MDDKTLLMALMMLIVFLVGTALDFTPNILIVAPVLMPVVKAAGIDPVYFGVLFIMNAAIGMITPPIGVVLNTVCGVAKIRMEEAIRGVVPFLVAESAVLVLLILFPAIVTVPVKWFF
jgi:TRAP-type C4-dicarboxylate transport system permease large subunit